MTATDKALWILNWLTLVAAWVALLYAGCAACGWR